MPECCNTLSTRLINLFFGQDPYQGFDLDSFPSDLQGWGSSHPILEEAVRFLRPKCIFELGTWKGASAIHMAQAAARHGVETSIVCIDTWLGNVSHFLLKDSPDHFRSLHMRNGYPQLYYQFMANVLHSDCRESIVPLPQTSFAAARILQNFEQRAQLIYVDAAHEYEEVLRDLTLYWDLLEEGGGLIGDDYHWTWPGVPQAFREFSQRQGLPLYMWGSKCFIGKGTSYVPSEGIDVSNNPNLFFDFAVGGYKQHTEAGV